MNDHQLALWLVKKERQLSKLKEMTTFSAQDAARQLEKQLSLVKIGKWRPDQPPPKGLFSTATRSKRQKRRDRALQKQERLQAFHIQPKPYSVKPTLNPSIYQCMYCNFNTEVLSTGLRNGCPKCLKKGFHQYFPDLVKLLLENESKNLSN